MCAASKVTAADAEVTCVAASGRSIYVRADRSQQSPRGLDAYQPSAHKGTPPPPPPSLVPPFFCLLKDKPPQRSIIGAQITTQSVSKSEMERNYPLASVHCQRGSAISKETGTVCNNQNMSCTDSPSISSKLRTPPPLTSTTRAEPDCGGNEALLTCDDSSARCGNFHLWQSQEIRVFFLFLFSLLIEPLHPHTPHVSTTFADGARPGRHRPFGGEILRVQPGFPVRSQTSTVA